MLNGKPIAIIGGGLAGLTAANHLRQHGVPVVLFEAGPKVSGLAQSHMDSDGFSLDVGAHFISNRLAGSVGIGGQSRLVKYYGESVWLRGKTYTYPLGLAAVPRFATAAVLSRLSKRSAHDAAAEFTSRYGEALAREVAIPITEAWSGASARDLSPEVVSKLQHGVLKVAALKRAARKSGRAVCSGYSQTLPEHSGVWHVYPEGGVTTVCERLANPVVDAIRLECPAEKVYIENNHAVGVRAGGRDYEVSGVVSTAPCPPLARMIAGSSALEEISRFRYRPMVFVNLRFSRRAILPDTVLWTPGRDVPFFRLTETTISMPWLAPEGKAIITADIGCETTSAVWTMDPERLGQLCLDSLEEIRPGAKSSYIGCRVLKTAVAYPVFLLSYEDARRKWQRSTGISGLWSVGRNGEFAHLLMEDVYWRTKWKMTDAVMHWRNPARMTDSLVTA